jgi:hypothetical protein
MFSITTAEDKINSIMIKCLIGRVNCNSGIYQFVCSGPATPCSEILVEIKVPTDTYPAETTWSLSNQCGIVRGMSGGPFSSENKYYFCNVPECLPASEYKFTINGSAEDGLCCKYGSGCLSMGSAHILVESLGFLKLKHLECEQAKAHQ